MPGYSEPSIGYVIRIIRILAENRQIGITKLISLSKINHHRCLEVLAWMRNHGYIEVVANGRLKRRKNVIVTEEGSKYIRSLGSVPLP